MGIAWLCASSLGCTITYSHFDAPTPYPLAAPDITLTVQDALSIAVLPSVPPPTAPPQLSIVVSPQPSPTPHYYTVQPNDTLMDIALQHDILLDDLLLANPNVSATALQIGQPLLIVKNRADLLLAPVPPLTVPAPQCHPTPTEQLLCVGTVFNSLPKAVEHLTIEVHFFDAQQALLHRQTVEPALSVIHPNERAPYHFYIGHLTLEQIAGVGTLLVGGSETDTATARFVPLQTQNLTYERLDNQVKVTFEVVNPTEQTAQNVRVLVAFYEGDHVLAYRIFERAGSFPPQTTWQVAESFLLLSSAVTDSPPILQLEAPLQQDALPTPTP